MPDTSSLSAAHTFPDLGLPPQLLAAVGKLGYQAPTEIQTAVIPALLAGHDVTGVAQTGTGKTAAFGLPLLAHIDPSRKGVQALVLTPTRELAIQVSDAITAMAALSQGVQVVSIYGGSSYTAQLRALSAGAQVVVGTPGRVIDLATRKSLNLAGVSYLVLDEADEMLRMGFAEDVETILSHTGETKQVALFSATMPPAIRRVARTHLHDPIEVATSRPSSTTSTINQTYAVVPAKHKIGALARVLGTTEAEAALVFVRTRDSAEEVALALTERGTPAASISGDVPQRDREKIVERLRSGALDVLVATDVAARGLDVERLGLVVNFDVPREVEAYVHRIGRTGRAGRAGTALSFFSPRERSRLAMIEKATRTPLTEVQVPTPAQVSAHRAGRVLSALPDRIGRGRLQMYREQAQTFAHTHGVDPLEAAAALLAVHVGDPGPAPRHNESDQADGGAELGAGPDGDFTATFSRSSGTGEDRPLNRRKPGRTSRGTVYRVAVGRTHGVRPEAIVGAITGEGGLHGRDLGKIDIYSRFSLVEINADVGPQAKRRLDRAVVAGQRMRLRPDDGPSKHRKTYRSTAAPHRTSRRG